MANRKKIERPKPTYFLSLTLENVRCFGKPQTIDFCDKVGSPAQWTVILGDNGIGKTTLLQACLGTFPVSPPDPKEELPFASFILFVAPNLSHLIRSDSESMATSGNFAFGCKLTELSSSSHNFNISFSLFSNDRTYSTTQSLESSSIKVAFTCIGYSAERRISNSNISSSKRSPNLSNDNLFNNDADLLNPEEWLFQLDYAASKQTDYQKESKKHRDQILNMLIDLLPDISDIRFTEPKSAREIPRVEFKTPYGWVELRSLSNGFKTMIAWMVDLAARLFELYPDSPNPLAEPAVVLVDEIDLHLHPKWQRNIMKYLSERFPNTQFIVTAHSPLIVQAATEANIVVLRREGDEVIIDNDVKSIRGWRIDQVLTSDLFDLETARPPEFDELLAQRKTILSKNKLSTTDKRKLRALDEKIGELPTGETPEDMEAMDIIRKAAAVLKKEQSAS